jgi:hypothetical protein
MLPLPERISFSLAYGVKICQQDLAEKYLMITKFRKFLGSGGGGQCVSNTFLPTVGKTDKVSFFIKYI